MSIRTGSSSYHLPVRLSTRTGKQFILSLDSVPAKLHATKSISQHAGYGASCAIEDPGRFCPLTRIGFISAKSYQLYARAALNMSLKADALIPAACGCSAIAANAMRVCVFPPPNCELKRYMLNALGMTLPRVRRSNISCRPPTASSRSDRSSQETELRPPVWIFHFRVSGADSRHSFPTAAPTVEAGRLGQRV